MSDRRPTNSELRLNRETDEQRSDDHGIFVLWLDDDETHDEDAPLARDDSRE